MLTNTTDRELVVTRIFDAPVDLVFKVWTEPAHLEKWWGPNGFTNSIHKMDVRPGGEFVLTMHGADGTDYPNKIVYDEVIKNKLLRYSHGSGMENDPRQFQVTVQFSEQDNKTLLTMRMVFVSKEEFDRVVQKYGAIEGNRQTMDKLEAYLKNNF